MGYISGNQDRARFISYAGGSLRFDEDAKKAGWKRNIEVGDPIAYKKLCMLNAFNMTIPGVPTIYYGDEFGLPGGNDPDNRRLMKFGALNFSEKTTLDITKKLIALRKNNLALIYGDFRTLLVDQDVYVFSRVFFNSKAIVIFNKSNQPRELKIKLPQEYYKKSLSANFGSNYKIKDEELTITMAANTFEILVAKK
jgi:glycosidase